MAEVGLSCRVVSIKLDPRPDVFQSVAKPQQAARQHIVGIRVAYRREGVRGGVQPRQKRSQGDLT